MGIGSGSLRQDILITATNQTDAAIGKALSNLGKLHKEGSSTVLSAGAESANRGFLGLAAGGLAESVAKVGGLIGVAKMAVGAISAMGESLREAAAQSDQMDSLKRSVAGVEEIMAQAKAASEGMISDRVLQQQITTFRDFGIPLERFAELTGLVAKSSITTGKSVDFLFESLTTGIGRLSPQRLDNVNVLIGSMDEVAKRAAVSLGKTVDELTESEQRAAVLSETMTALAANTRNVSLEAGDTAAYDRLAAAWDNVSVRALNFAARVAAPVVEAISSIITPARELGTVLDTVVDGKKVRVRVISEADQRQATRELLSRFGFNAEIAAQQAREVMQAAEAAAVAEQQQTDIRAAAAEAARKDAAEQVEARKELLRLQKEAAAIGKAPLDLALEEKKADVEAIEKMEGKTASHVRAQVEAQRQLNLLLEAQQEQRRRDAKPKAAKPAEEDLGFPDTLFGIETYMQELRARWAAEATARRDAVDSMTSEMEALIAENNDRLLEMHQELNDARRESDRAYLDSWAQGVDDAIQMIQGTAGAFDFAGIGAATSALVEGLDAVAKAEGRLQKVRDTPGHTSEDIASANQQIAGSYIAMAGSVGTAIAKQIKDERARAAVMAAIYAAEAIAYAIAQDYSKMALAITASGLYAIAAATGGSRGGTVGSLSAPTRAGGGRDTGKDREGTTVYNFGPFSFVGRSQEAAATLRELTDGIEGTGMGRRAA